MSRTVSSAARNGIGGVVGVGVIESSAIGCDAVITAALSALTAGMLSTGVGASCTDGSRFRGSGSSAAAAIAMNASLVIACIAGRCGAGGFVATRSVSGADLASSRAGSGGGPERRDSGTTGSGLNAGS